MKQASSFQLTHPYEKKKKCDGISDIWSNQYDVLHNPLFCLCGVCFFIIAIIILTTVKWITEVSAEHPAETCLGQQ